MTAPRASRCTKAGMTATSVLPNELPLAARPEARATAWALVRFIFQLPATKGLRMGVDAPKDPRKDGTLSTKNGQKASNGGELLANVRPKGLFSGVQSSHSLLC